MASIVIAKDYFYADSPDSELLSYEACEVLQLKSEISHECKWLAQNSRGETGQIECQNFDTLTSTSIFKRNDELDHFIRYLNYLPKGTFIIAKGGPRTICFYFFDQERVCKREIRFQDNENNEHVCIAKYIVDNRNILKYFVDKTSIVFANRHLNNFIVIAKTDIVCKSGIDLHGKKGTTFQVTHANENGIRYLARDLNEQTKGYLDRDDVLPFMPEWFHGYQNREWNDNILRGKPVWSYLVRLSFRTGNFVLSVKHSDETEKNQNVHIEIEQHRNGVVCGKGVYSSLVNVIENLSKKSFTLSKRQYLGQIRLVYPVSCPDILIPTDIERLDPVYIELYIKALTEGKEKRGCLRVMVIGHFGVGKTSLVRNLLGMSLYGIESTDGIDVHACQVRDEAIWQPYTSEIKDIDTFARIARVARSESTGDNKEINEVDDINQAVESLSLHGMEYNNGVDQRNQSENKHQSKQSQKAYANVGVNSQSREGDANSKSGENIPSNPITADHSDIPEQKRNSLKQFMSAYENEDTHGQFVEERTLNIWDFGGQYIFYATHQLFHSPQAVYLLVLDVSKSLNDRVVDDDHPNDSFESVDQNVHSLCKYWMSSIHSFVGNQKGQPPVILVGTHKDSLAGNDTEKDALAEQYFDDIREIFSGTPLLEHIASKHFLVDNLEGSDEVLVEIKRHIIDVGSVQEGWIKELPARWIPLETCLLRRKHERLMTFAEVCKINSENEYPVEDDEEIKLFLTFHHLQGTFVYFDEGTLSNCVVLDPQWIIDAFKCIITSKRFCKVTPSLRYLWDELIGKGTLKSELIDDVWGRKGFIENKAILIKFLSKLGIISRVKYICEETNETKELDSFIVPSLLKCQSLQRNVIEIMKSGVRTSTLVFVFQNKFVPPTLYHRTTAVVLGKWPIVKYAGTYMLYGNFGMYQLDGAHVGIIAMTGKTIELVVINLCKMPIVTRQSDRFRRYIELALRQELERISRERECQYSLGVRCNRNDLTDHTIIDIDRLNTDKIVICLDCSSPHAIESTVVMTEWFPHKVAELRHEMVKDFTTEMIMRPVTSAEINKIAKAIGLNWELLGLALGMSTATIEQIKMDYKYSSSLQIYHMLNTIIQKEGERANLNIVLQTMAEIPHMTVEWDQIKNMLE